METIKVSVLIYVKNGICHIEECIRSVMNQTLKEIEILIIDGGSTDGTLEIIDEMRGLDSRIRVFHTKPSVGMQFNTGLREAKGEYIGICESDDYILPDMYENQYKTAKESRLDILKANFNRFCGAGERKVILPFNILEDHSFYNQVICPRDHDYMLKMGVISYWSGIYRREFLLEHHIFMNETRGAAYQDTSFAFLSLFQADRVMVQKEAYYCYRWDNPNSSVNAPQKMTTLMEEYRELKKRLEREKIFALCKEYYFCWKIGGLAWFYSRLPENQKTEYAHLLFTELYGDMDSGEFQGNKLMHMEREIVDRVMHSEDCLKEYLRGNEEITLRTKQLLKQACGRSVIIFGNGNMGKLVRLYIENTGGTVAAYMDNKQEFWGKTDRGVPVLSPECAAARFFDGVYIVANVNHYEEMEKQLLGLGIAHNSIITCRDYDFFLSQVGPD